MLKVWVTVTPLYADSDRPTALATTERDISERVELDALRVQTDRLSSMVEHLPVGAVYRENDHLMMNRAAEEITGYSRDELATPELWFKKLYGEREAEMRRHYQVERAAGFPRQTGPFQDTQK